MKLTSSEIYGVLMAIASTRGSNKKKEVLSAYKDSNIKNILQLIYSPYIHFNRSVSLSKAQATLGSEDFSDRTNALLSGILKGIYTGNSAQSRINIEIAKLNYKSAMLLCHIINKDLKIGMGAKSINDVIPNLIPIHSVQLASPLDTSKLGFPCISSPKLDGLRGSFDSIEQCFRSRIGNKLVGLSKLEKQAYQLCYLTNEKSFDGELMVPGEHFNEISGKIRSFSETDNAVFHIFDMPDSTLNMNAKKHLLDQVQKVIDNTPSITNIKVVPHTLVYTAEEMYAKHEEYMAAKFEGSIIKKLDGTYHAGRSHAWMKIKAFNTEDLVVVDTFQGQGKYLSMLGGLIVDFNGKEVRVGSGLTDSQRAFWSENPHEIIGSIVEVGYHEVTPDGSLRHPRLIRVRGDKDA